MSHMLGNLLPSFAIVEDAGHRDSVRALAATANLEDGDILVADRAYTDFGFLKDEIVRPSRKGTAGKCPADDIPAEKAIAFEGSRRPSMWKWAGEN